MRIFRETVDTGVGQRAQFRFRTKDGNIRFIESQSSVIPGPSGKTERVVVVSRDVTERLDAEERLRHLAHHDMLTGLPNRTLLLDRLGQAQAVAKRLRSHLAVLFLDLDDFKEVNDTLGHAYGDQLLCTVSQRLTKCVRATDSVARQGGDEFIVLLQGLARPDDALLVAQKLLMEVSQPITLGSHSRAVTCSIGMSFYPQDGSDTETLLKKADMAMYHAKAAGKNEYRVFTEQMDVGLRQRLELKQGLQLALERDEFVLHYQPRVGLADGEVRSVEALVRWQRPGHGLVGPGQFISHAEETGLILPLGEWVLREACRQGHRWLETGLQLRVAVNVSAHQFQDPNFAGLVIRVLEEVGLEPRWLELELTESSLLLINQASSTFDRLREMGVRFAIDDFGTGYSSLNYLKRLGVDRLKIDRSFIAEVTHDRNDAAIVRAIIAMAKGLEIEVTAEGVETTEQCAFLRGEGCGDAQGFMFCRPMPAPELEAFVRTSQVARLPVAAVDLPRAAMRDRRDQ